MELLIPRKPPERGKISEIHGGVPMCKDRIPHSHDLIESLLEYPFYRPEQSKNLKNLQIMLKLTDKEQSRDNV